MICCIYLRNELSGCDYAFHSQYNDRANETESKQDVMLIKPLVYLCSLLCAISQRRASHVWRTTAHNMCCPSRVCRQSGKEIFKSYAVPQYVCAEYGNYLSLRLELENFVMKMCGRRRRRRRGRSETGTSAHYVIIGQT